MTTVRLHVPKLAALLTLGLVSTAFAGTQNRDVKGYSKIRLESSLDLEIQEGKGFSFQLTAPDKELARYTTEVQGDTLVIGTKSEGFHWFKGRSERAVARITLPELRALQIEGSGDARIAPLTHAHDLDIAIQGSGDVRVSGSVAKFSVRISGSGDVTFGAGSAQALDVHVSGSGDVDAKALTTKVANVATNGSGDVTLTVDGGPVELSSSGSGDIDWYGRAQQVQSHSSGSGDITHH